MLGQLGLPGLLILLVVCLIAFGSKNLPSIAKSIGESLREFKGAFSIEGKHQKESLKEDSFLNDEERKKL